MAPAWKSKTFIDLTHAVTKSTPDSTSSPSHGRLTRATSNQNADGKLIVNFEWNKDIRVVTNVEDNMDTETASAPSVTIPGQYNNDWNTRLRKRV